MKEIQKYIVTFGCEECIFSNNVKTKQATIGWCEYPHQHHISNGEQCHEKQLQSIHSQRG